MNNLYASELVCVFDEFVNFIGLPLVLTHFGITKIDDLKDSHIIQLWADSLEEENIPLSWLFNSRKKIRALDNVPTFNKFKQMCEPDYQHEYSKFLSHSPRSNPVDVYMHNISLYFYNKGIDTGYLQANSANYFDIFKEAFKHVSALKFKELTPLPQKTIKLEKINNSFDIKEFSEKDCKVLIDKIRMKICLFQIDEGKDAICENGLEIQSYLVKNIPEYPSNVICKISEQIIYEADTVIKATFKNQYKEPKELTEFKKQIEAKVPTHVYNRTFKPLKMQIKGNTVQLLVKSNFQLKEINNNHSRSINNFKQAIGDYNLKLMVG